jgi:hypothetical protein
MPAMKIVSAALLAAAALGVSPALAAPVCLRTHDIVGSESKDGKILTFHMRDGTVWRNHLQSQCNGLIFNGYVWVVRGGTDTVCENAQTLRVLQSGQICSLGKFDPPVKPAPKPAAH